MAFIFDPIESGINSLLAPLTSVASSTDSSGDDPTTSTSATPIASSVIVITPISSSKTSKSTPTEKSTSSHTTSATTLSPTPTTLMTSTVSSSSTTSSTDSSITSTSSSSSVTDTTTQSSTSSTSQVPVPTPFPSAPSAAASSSNTDPPPSSSPSAISTAGIIIAIIFTVAILASIFWLVARFCPPVRKRIDAWTARRRRERSYREALDGPAVPAKDSGAEPYSASSSDHPYARDRHFSFFALGRNPQIDNTNAAVVHQQYVSPQSANPRGHGLGLGRVSLLRNHSLLRKAGHDVPDMPVLAREVTPSSVERGSVNGTMTATMTMTRGRNSPLPRLHVEIPHAGMDGGHGYANSDGLMARVSQIGLAVTGTPQLGGHQR